MSPHYEFPRPALTVDTVVLDFFMIDDPKVLLIRRKNSPFQNMWAIPGGFLDIDEELACGAARELLEETGVDIAPIDLVQAFTVGDIGRDPRGRIISVVYYTITSAAEHVVRAGDDAVDAKWFPINDLPNLAADHLHIICEVLKTHSKH